VREAALGPFVQAAHVVVGQRHLARQRHVAPADPPHIGDGVIGRAQRAGDDQRRAVTGAAGDASSVHRHVPASLTRP
jgi:hypothetical protein